MAIVRIFFLAWKKEKRRTEDGGNTSFLKRFFFDFYYTSPFLSLPPLFIAIARCPKFKALHIR